MISKATTRGGLDTPMAPAARQRAPAFESGRVLCAKTCPYGLNSSPEAAKFRRLSCVLSGDKRHIWALPTPWGEERMQQPHPTIEATVVAELPQQLFRLESKEGPIIAGRSEDATRQGMLIRTGQRVRVKRARLDPGRGVIISVAEPG